MPKLLYFNGSQLHNSRLIDEIPGLANFLKIQKFFQPNAGIIDRSGTLVSPLNVQISNPLPSFDYNFNLSYKDCVLSRVKELDQIHQSTGKGFRLLYSGGIDSTTILAGFVEYFGLSRTSQILEICCTPESIDENPGAWEKYISQGNFKISSALTYQHNWEEFITIMGEGNDHLFGGLGTGPWPKFSDDLYAPANCDILANYLAWYTNEKTLSDATYSAEQFLRIAGAAPFTIDNMYLLIWWYKFVLDWEAIQLRAVVLSSLTQLPSTFLQTNFIQFFNTENLQQWSMHFHKNNPTRFCETHLYKQACKDMILEILDIPEYANKGKFLSWPRVHSLIPSGVMIDTNLTIHTDPMDFLQFINPDNSFVQ